MKYLGETSLPKLMSLIKNDKQDKITANGILKGDGNGGVTAVTTTYVTGSLTVSNWSAEFIVLNQIIQIQNTISPSLLLQLQPPQNLMLLLTQKFVVVRTAIQSLRLVLSQQ